MTADPTLVDVAAELYSGSIDGFVAARNAAAAQVRDADLAARIRALKKPSVAAWVVNVFARERADHLADVLRLADELREAQADLDARALAQLGRDRRTLTDRLAASASDFVEERGERVTASTREAVRQTIAAAFFDPIAAAALASGRLIRELEPAAEYDAIAETLIAGGPASRPSATERPVDEVRARRERRDAERALRDAEHAHARAQHDAATADRALREATLRLEDLSHREQELEAELVDLRLDIQRSQEEVVRTEESQEERAQRVADTEETVRRAQLLRDRLPRP